MCEEKEKNHFTDVKDEMKQLIQLLQTLNLADSFQNNMTIVQSFNEWFNNYYFL